MVWFGREELFALLPSIDMPMPASKTHARFQGSLKTDVPSRISKWHVLSTSIAKRYYVTAGYVQRLGKTLFFFPSYYLSSSLDSTSSNSSLEFSSGLNSSSFKLPLLIVRTLPTQSSHS